VTDWHAFDQHVGRYAGLELRGTAAVSQLPGATRRAAWAALHEQAGRWFDRPPHADDVASALEKSEVLAVALQDGRLVGAVMGRRCDVPGTSPAVYYLSTSVTAPGARRLGINLRLMQANVALAYPDWHAPLTAMWGRRIALVVRTQNLAVYHGLRRGLRGVAPVGTRPDATLQGCIDATARAFGWAAAADNIHRDVYRQRLAQRLVPTLGERDAVVLAGWYSWRSHAATSLALRVAYPIRHAVTRALGRRRRQDGR
jgi:ribosomal protein S18 acetylase RimI-like enzyme